MSYWFLFIYVANVIGDPLDIQVKFKVEVHEGVLACKHAEQDWRDELVDDYVFTQCEKVKDVKRFES